MVTTMNRYGDRSEPGAYVDIETRPEPARRRGALGPRLLAALGVVALALAGCVTSEKASEGPDLSDFVWPLPPEQPRIQFVRFLSNADDVDASNFSLKDALLGDDGKPRRTALKKPYGVHADSRGRVFVTDTGWGKVIVFDTENKKLSVWGEGGKGYLAKPIGVTSDSSGRVYVTDVAKQRVVVFNEDGSFHLAMGKKGELESPTGVALDEARGRLYVVDTKRHHIIVFDMEGNIIDTIGERGSEAGQFNFPTNLQVDRAGSLYVMDTMNFRLQILDPDGEPVTAFGELGNGPGRFGRPKGVAVDSDGHIYVVDAAFNKIQIFDREGRLMLFVGELGRRPGQFWLPAGAYIDAQNRLYVADQFNYRIQVFQYLTEEEGKAALAAQNEKADAQSKKAN